MVDHSDWLSIALYFDSIGKRSLSHYNKYYRNLLFGDADPEISYPMFLRVIGLDPAKEPSLETQEQAVNENLVRIIFLERQKGQWTT